MSLLSATELKRIEATHAGGISSAEIVGTFSSKGERFSAATLRKYVQLGLLPKSRRVGTRGRHRGSTGLYPVGVVRLINEIKRGLEKGATLEEIKLGAVGLGGELQVLEHATQQVVDRFTQAITRLQPRRRVELKRALDKHRRALLRELRALDKFAARVGRNGGMGV